MSNRDRILNDSETAMRYVLQGLQSQMWTALPGIIEDVDLEAMTVSVQPSIQGVVTSTTGVRSYVDLPLLVDVPICFPSGGGFILTLPLAKDDEVLVVFSSRCIDAWWQSGGTQQPMELRMHDLSDGFAIPGPRSQPEVVSAISSDNAQLRSDDGSVFLEITPDGKINMTAPSGVTITGDLTVTGDISAQQDLEVVGTTTLDGTTTIEGREFLLHEHSGVVAGSGISGGVV